MSSSRKPESVVSASDLVSNLYDKKKPSKKQQQQQVQQRLEEDSEDSDSDDIDNDDSEDEDNDDDSDDNEMNEEDVVDDLNYDVYNLVARNYHPLHLNLDDNKNSNSTQMNAILQEHFTRAAQLLVKKVFECPIERSEVGPIAVLPNETTRLPREKPIPEAAPETKWERFAKTKGIQKKKRERMVFDEDNQQWAPRYGYKRAKGDETDLPVMEVKQGTDPYADPWEVAREAKKARIEKNKNAAMKNKERAEGKRFGRKSINAETADAMKVAAKGAKGTKGGKGNDDGRTPIPSGVPVDLSLRGSSSSSSSSGSGKKQLRGKENLKTALQMAQYSTQSLGRFDTLRAGEPAKKLKGKKQAYRDNMAGVSTEKSIMKSQMRIAADATHKKVNHVSNSIAKYEGILPDAPSNQFKQKKGLMKVKKGGAGGKGKK